MKYIFLSLLGVFSLSLLGFDVRAQEPARQQVLAELGEYNGDALGARIANLRQQYKINLTDGEKQRLRERCVKAQTGLQSILDRTDAIAERRSSTYSGVINALTNFKGLVSSRNIDSSNVELLVVEYQQKRIAFDAAIDAYQVTLQDAVLVDCVTNPEDFVAALEGVRAARKEVVAVSSQIRELTKANLGTALDTVFSRLKETEEQSDGRE